MSKSNDAELHNFDMTVFSSITLISWSTELGPLQVFLLRYKKNIVLHYEKANNSV